MATVTMPQLGESVTEGTVIKWLKQPGEPVALDDSLCEIETEKVTAELPSPYEGTMGEILVLGQQFLPARALLMLQLAMSGGKDERPIEVLMRLEGTPSVSVLLKDPPAYYGPQPAAPWQGEFEVALQLASRGWWRAAAARWEKLTEQAAQSAALWHNLATVRGNLADYPGAIEALRRYAALNDVTGDVSLDDAIEAEALAQLLDREDAEGSVDSLLVTFAVNDMDELERRLASDRQADRMDIDPRAFAATLRRLTGA